MKDRVILGAVAVFLATTLSTAVGVQAQSEPLASVATFPDFPMVQGKVYKFAKVAEGVYYVTGGTGGNQTVIVNESDVFLVDDGNTPAAARELLQDIKLITEKPVRRVVNTHFHYDHTDGNQVFPPDVEIIGQENVRSAILTGTVLEHEPYLTTARTNTKLIESLSAQIAAEPDPTKKAELEKQLAAQQLLREQLKEIKPTPPNVTYATKMVVYDGSREIQLLFLGRGHTSGDTVVYLPKEHIVCTGDLMTSNVAYMGDAFFEDWIATLGEIKKLDFRLVLPGHGKPFEGKGLMTEFQGYMTELIKQVSALHSQGVSADEAAKRVDLTAYQKYFANIRGVGAEPRGVRHMYQLLDQRDKK